MNDMCPYCKSMTINQSHVGYGKPSTCGDPACILAHKKHLKAVYRKSHQLCNKSGEMFPSRARERGLAGKQMRQARKLIHIEGQEGYGLDGHMDRILKSTGIYNPKWPYLYGRKPKKLTAFVCKECGAKSTANNAKACLCSSKCRIAVHSRSRAAKRYRREFKLFRCMRDRITKALKSRGVHWTFKTKELLGYDENALRARLECMFEPGMTWLNQGSKWHIDHIIPCSTFEHTQEGMKMANRLNNLMPRWATTSIALAHGSNQIGNCEKSNRIIQ